MAEKAYTQDEDEAPARYWAEEAGYAAIASLLRQYGTTE